MVARVFLFLLIVGTGSASAEVSCRTLGWISAAAETAMRETALSPIDRDRLARLMVRYNRPQLRVALLSNLTKRQTNTVITFLDSAETEGDVRQIPDEAPLSYLAQSALRELNSLRCVRGTSDDILSEGPGSEGSGMNPDAGTDYVYRQREGFLAKASSVAPYALAGIAVLCGTLWAFRLSARGRRRKKRYPCSLECAVNLAGSDVRATMTNISEDGCRLELPSENHDHSALTLRAANSDIGASKIWSHENSVGLKFDEPISTQLVSEIRAAAQDQWNERRREQRMSKLQHLSIKRQNHP